MSQEKYSDQKQHLNIIYTMDKENLDLRYVMEISTYQLNSYDSFYRKNFIQESLMAPVLYGLANHLR